MASAQQPSGSAWLQSHNVEANIAAAVTAAIKERPANPLAFIGQKLIASSKASLLVFVGTYGEKLGHVEGKGEGVYVLRFDPITETFAAPSGLIGKAQLRGLTNPTYLCTHRDPTTCELHLYVVDEKYGDAGGTVVAARVDEDTGELQELSRPVPAGGTGTCHVTVAPGGKHGARASLNALMASRRPYALSE
jgi:6-phosphogluconolactonase (cycloisomerase 2 family)